MRDLRCGLLDESFGCGGPTLASELQQSQLSDVLQRTRVQWELFDYSNRERTVSNANPARVTGVLQWSRVRQTSVWVRGLLGSQNPHSVAKNAPRMGQPFLVGVFYGCGFC